MVRQTLQDESDNVCLSCKDIHGYCLKLMFFFCKVMNLFNLGFRMKATMLACLVKIEFGVFAVNRVGWAVSATSTFRGYFFLHTLLYKKCTKTNRIIILKPSNIHVCNKGPKRQFHYPVINFYDFMLAYSHFCLSLFSIN